MAGWHHRFSGHELGQALTDGEGQRGLACCSSQDHRAEHDLMSLGWTLGVGDGQGGPACCGSWGCKELDMTK